LPGAGASGWQNPLVPHRKAAPAGAGEEAVVAAATTDDEAAFAALVRRHQRELHVHCYRMLGSFEEAEDLVQETFLRAWRRRETFEGGGFRAWLYRIATNACLDALRRSARRVPSAGSTFAEVPWIQPYPDRLLDEVAPSEDQPDAVVVARETIELAFLAVIQLLPPRQRAVLILRDVLGWSAGEVAKLLDTTAAAVNSALQRARATLQEHSSGRALESSLTEPTEGERALLRRFIDMHESGDVAAAAAMLRRDARVTMPPYPWRFEGQDAIVPLIERARGDGDWRLLPTSANRQPAAASYLRAPGETGFRAFKLDVLRVEGGLIAEITTFGPGLFEAFGLPPEL
jgi:RNA polymerase sigma-70 factor (TIGR02960 family)